jgi:hypothetical protein
MGRSLDTVLRVKMIACASWLSSLSFASSESQLVIGNAAGNENLDANHDGIEREPEGITAIARLGRMKCKTKMK